MKSHFGEKSQILDFSQNLPIVWYMIDAILYTLVMMLKMIFVTIFNVKKDVILLKNKCYTLYISLQK